MGKKRKTYYLDEETIQRVKSYARQQELSENDCFETMLNIAEKFYYEAEQFVPLPKEYCPLLLEAIDNLLYSSKRILETGASVDQTINSSIGVRIQLLQEIRAKLMETS
jgi:hypothetical protein